MPFPIPFFVGGSSPSITYVGTLTDDTGQTTYTFTDANIDGPGLIVVGVHWDAGSARTLSSATIGGSSATVVCDSGSGANGACIIARRITSGTLATIAVTMSGACNNMRLGIWRIQDIASDTAQTSNTSGFSTSNPKSFTISVAADDCIVAVADNTLSSGSFTWTSPMPEKYDSNAQSGHCSSAASYQALTANAAFLVEVSSSGNNNGLSVATWR